MLPSFSGAKLFENEPDDKIITWEQGILYVMVELNMTRQEAVQFLRAEYEKGNLPEAFLQ